MTEDALTLDAVRDALRRIEQKRYTSADMAIVRAWIARQDATIATQAQRIAELQQRNGVLSRILDEEA